MSMSRFSPASTIRLSKLLSRAGVCSRREAERLMMEGKVTVGEDAVKSPGKVFDISYLRRANKLIVPVPGAIHGNDSEDEDSDDEDSDSLEDSSCSGDKSLGIIRVNGKQINVPLSLLVPTSVVQHEKLSNYVQGTRLWMYHKPRGMISSRTDEYDRPTVTQALHDLARKHSYLRLPQHIINVGRLDFNSEGLLLLTNNGDLARLLEHPSTALPRRYFIRCHRQPTSFVIRQLQQGPVIDGQHYAPIMVSTQSLTPWHGRPAFRGKMRQDKYREDIFKKRGIENALHGERPHPEPWLQVTLSEGKNREIRRVFEHFGHPVLRVIRVNYGPYNLGDLPRGQIASVPIKNSLKNIMNGIQK